jgi:hypothetical protein
VKQNDNRPGTATRPFLDQVMPKKKAAAVPEPVLISKLIKWPQDWIDRIDSARGDVPFSEFVRQAVADKIGADGLSEMPGWGTGRWKDKKD